MKTSSSKFTLHLLLNKDCCEYSKNSQDIPPEPGSPGKRFGGSASYLYQPTTLHKKNMKMLLNSKVWNKAILINVGNIHYLLRNSKSFSWDSLKAPSKNVFYKTTIVVKSSLGINDSLCLDIKQEYNKVRKTTF